MKKTQSSLVFLISAILLLFATSANAFFYTWDGEKTIKIMDLPDTPEFQDADGDYYDIGAVYKQLTVLLVPLWNYDIRWCGAVEGGSSYIDLDQQYLSELAKSANLTLPNNIQLPFWDSYGGKVVVGLLLALFILYSYYKSNKNSEESDAYRSE